MKNPFFYILLILSAFSFLSCDGLLDDDDPTVPEKAPIADFEMDKSICEAPCEVTFSNFFAGDDSCLWDFGDGSSTSDECIATHTFTTAGEFEITHTVTKPSGSSAEKTRVLRVTDSTINNEEHPFAGIKTFPSMSNTAALEAIEVENGFIVLSGSYWESSPLNSTPEFSFLTKYNYYGEIVSTIEYPGFAAYDILKTLNGRIIICGQKNNHGYLLEIDQDFGNVRDYSSNRTGSVFTSIDHNQGNDVVAAGYQDLGEGTQGALVEFIRSNFTFIDDWQVFDETLDLQFDNVVINGNDIYFSAYELETYTFYIYKMLPDFSDIATLVTVNDSNIRDLEVDDEYVYAPTVRPVGFRSHLFRYDLELNLESDVVISDPASDDILYPSDIHLIEGHYLLSSYVINNDPNCVISTALQHVCNGGTQCITHVIDCFEENILVFFNHITKLENGEFFAVGTSSNSDSNYASTLLMLDKNFEVKY